MSYIIRITKIDNKAVTKRGEHTIIQERPWTDEALSSESFYGSQEAFLKKTPLERVYGYAPSWEGFETEETEILKQTVDELDLPSVIIAVNGLTAKPE